MSDIWQRKRQPDEVPTPLAVALSDFCRRAKAPASPLEVREALALVSGDEEFRVRQLTDGEPQATPLGPFAAIDVLQGAAPQTDLPTVLRYTAVQDVGTDDPRPLEPVSTNRPGMRESSRRYFCLTVLKNPA